MHFPSVACRRSELPYLVLDSIRKQRQFYSSAFKLIGYQYTGPATGTYNSHVLPSRTRHKRERNQHIGHFLQGMYSNCAGLFAERIPNSITPGKGRGVASGSPCTRFGNAPFKQYHSLFFRCLVPCTTESFPIFNSFYVKGYYLGIWVISEVFQ